MNIKCPHCKCDIQVVSEDRAKTCPSCGSRLTFLDETIVQDPADIRRLFRFEMLQHVGTGHFGEVWKARDALLDRFVAVKIPRTRQLDDKTIHLFVREARAAARLRHDNIVSVHEVVLDNPTVLIVSDFIQGVTLAEDMALKQRSPREAAELSLKVAEALDYAHNNGVEAHRDVKPGNIMIDNAGKPYIMDFGLAKLDGAEFTMTVAGQLLGTPSYMSPEQAEGSDTDRRTDVYSLGVVLYELLTHRRPFTGDTKLLIHQILSEEPRPPRQVVKSIPRSVETICLKAMSKDPDRRYPTAKAFADDLRRFLQGQPITARPVSPFERSWRWARRNPAIAASSLVVPLLLMALASVLWGQHEEARSEYRNITLETIPAGARVVFVPLDQLRRPVVDRMVSPSEASPIHEPLRPGHYLVVAKISDDEFHEVYRYVPADPDENSGLQNHNNWEAQSDGTIVLPLIRIAKTADVIGNMTHFPAGTFEVGSEKLSDAPRHPEQVGDYFLDQTEVTIEEYTVFKTVPAALADRPADEPVAFVDANMALDFAERAGKRLMTETEYEYAATQGGTRSFPWGDDPLVGPEMFQRAPVQNSVLDQTPTQPPVYGLYSNVTEWTDSLLIPYPRPNESATFSRDFIQQLQVTRVLRGGPVNDEELPAGAVLSERLVQGAQRRAAVLHNVKRPYIGFRCARSATARFID